MSKKNDFGNKIVKVCRIATELFKQKKKKSHSSKV